MGTARFSTEGVASSVPRVRKMVSHELRDCPTCEAVTEFEVYDSWDRSSRWSRVRVNARRVARCEACEYRIVLSA
jgi:hypothetical protein